MKKRMTALIGAVVMALALTACNGDEPVADPTPETPATEEASVDPEPEPEPEADLGCPDLAWPLTGVGTAEVAQRPGLAIKIENSPMARPQMGLEYADIVWEQLVEGGITRYVAVYHSQIPEAVLPVRSARPMDAAILSPMRGMFAYSGAQRVFIDMVNNAGIQSVIMDSGHAGFSRTSDRRAPHNVLGNPETFLSLARADREVPPPPQFVFACGTGQSDAILSGSPVTTLDVTMSQAQNSVWDWDEETSQFLLSNGTRPAVSTTDARLAATNVVLLEVSIGERYGVPETLLANREGRAIIAAGGRYIEATWSKGDFADLIILTRADGEEVRLEPGNTWINLVPTSGGWELS
ncbi:MAG: DUF3048 domain-containing protein [Promicromonosporaceae bacterium]|nr:DUF3048 domain-containing protein [Promicromonosporaceae bacterium]